MADFDAFRVRLAEHYAYPLLADIQAVADAYERAARVSISSKNVDDMAKRIRLVRHAYSTVQGLGRPMSQAKFAALCGVGVQQWNNAETGDNRLGVDACISIARITGVTLDYLYTGNLSGVPLTMATELGRLSGDVGDSVANAGMQSR